MLLHNYYYRVKLLIFEKLSHGISFFIISAKLNVSLYNLMTLIYYLQNKYTFFKSEMIHIEIEPFTGTNMAFLILELLERL